MPPRYAYWTILIDDKPTAFRARDQEELLPTLRQLQRKSPTAVMRWFARGRLWDNPEQAQWAAKNAVAVREKRSRDWRPGGEHKDPRERFKKRSADKLPAPKFEEPRRDASPTVRPLPKPRPERPAFRPLPKPRSGDPKSRPLVGQDVKRVGQGFSPAGAGARKPARPHGDRPWRKPQGDRPWQGKPGGAKPQRPWTGRSNRSRPFKRKPPDKDK